MQDRTSANPKKSSCNARPDHTFGSKPDKVTLKGYVRFTPDTVAKVRNRPMTIFPPKDDPTNDRRSLQPQTRYRGRP